MLIGKVATDFSIPRQADDLTPPPIPTGVPSQLLERRPDIAAAERTLAEANADHRHRLRRVLSPGHISAPAGFESSPLLSTLFDWPSRVWSIGPSVSQTIFDGGLYRAELHQYVASTTPTWPPTGRLCSPPSSRSRTTWPPRASTRSRFKPAASSQGCAGLSGPRDRSLQHRRRSLCRCGHRADHVANQPGDAENATNRRDGVSG